MKTVTFAVLPRFWRFAIIGCFGYLADVATLYAATLWLRTDPYRGRILSFLCAATVTWVLNRHFTFHDTRSRDHAKEWAKFVCLNGLGGIANYAVYATFIHAAAPSALTQAVGVALGSLAGLSINYFVSRQFVFVGPQPTGDDA